MRPIIRRAYSCARKLDKRLVVCLLWWLQFLAAYSPRPVPTCLSGMECIISYSDGEGKLAGIGAAVWVPGRIHPLALYSEVPVSLRSKWQAFTGVEGEFRDIYLVEALGLCCCFLRSPRYFEIVFGFISLTIRFQSLLSSVGHRSVNAVITWLG